MAKDIPCYKICPNCVHVHKLTDKKTVRMLYDEENHSMMCDVCGHVFRLPSWFKVG